MSKYIDELTELICDVVRTVFPNASLDDGYDVADEVIAKLPTIEVSEDCISREYLKSLGYINKGDFNSVETIREWIDNAPSVVPSRAEGRWLVKRLTDDYHIIGQCSLCKELRRIGNYCPNCGAKMKGADDDAD